MSPAWKTVRVFVSSTFRDMHAERDHLVKVTFPRLRQWCARHRLIFRGIDLRWGVPRAEADTSRVIEICLEEVDGCRPFFVCMLGARYGKTIDQLPPEAIFQFRGLQAATHKSITHLEIEHALWDPHLAKNPHSVPCEQAFFYFRNSDCVPSAETLSGYSQAEREKHQRTFFDSEGSERHELLTRLKDEIRARMEPLGHLFEYSGIWDPDAENWEDRSLRGRLTNLEAFGNRVESDLQRGISARHREHFSSLGHINALDAERFHHEAFIENRTQGHVPRIALEAKLTRYALAEGRARPLVLAGPPGSGKSALLAHWVKELRQAPDLTVVSRFIGASHASTSLHRLMRSIAEELIERGGLTDLDGRPLSLSTDPKELRRLWPWLLEQSGRRSRVVIVVDALNQLDLSIGPIELSWFERELPEGIRVILSVIKDQGGREPASDLASVLERAGLSVEELDLLSSDQRLDIVWGMRALWAKELEHDQVAVLLTNPATQNPLYLLVALEELRVFGSFESLNEEIQNLPTVSAEEGINAALEQLFARVLRRLEREQARVARGLVPALFGFLASARQGLAESDLSALLAAELPGLAPQVREDQMQVVLQQVQPYLMPKGVGTTIVLDFFHRSFWKAVQSTYLHDATVRCHAHERLADHFETQASFQDETPNERKAVELAWQRLRVLREALRTSDDATVESAWEPLHRLFSDRLFFAAKSALTLTDELVDECYQTHQLLGPAREPMTAALIGNLVELLVEGEENKSKGLRLDHVNAWLNYRNDTGLFERMLLLGLNQADEAADRSSPSSRLAYRCLSRLGSYRRRHGRLAEAEGHLHKAISFWEDAGDQKELGTAEYEQAYIHFLRNQLDDAARLFRKSAEHAFEAADTVGGWMSRCLQLRCEFLVDQITARKLIDETEKALQFFQDLADRTTPDAMRWAWNAKAQLIDAAFCSSDLGRAEQVFRSLSTDVWIKEYWEKENGPDWSLPYEARIAMLRNEWPRAIESLERYLGQDKRRIAEEAIAREYLDLGICHAEAGNAERALAAWKVGLECPDIPRNSMWKAAIEDAKTVLQTVGHVWIGVRSQLKR